MSRVRELSEFFEYLPVALYRSAPDGELLAGNLALARLLGFDSMDELRSHVSVVDGFYTDLSRRQVWLEQIEAEGVVHDFDVELRRKDGQILWVRDTARAVRNYDGTLRHLEGCMIDVTDRIRLERSRDRFIATVSHELRTPITAIYGLASELSSSYEGFSEEERTEMVSLITRQAEEASWLIEDLLVAHRADLSRVSISRVAFPILDEVTRVSEGIDADVPVVGGEGMEVVADPLRTRQILRNLVTNALRYGGNKTWIEVSARDDAVLVAVCDSGEPIDDATLDYIFEPFMSAKDHAHAVGLGLWISRRLSELMGGSVHYEHDGSESKFVLSLPVV